MAVSMFYKGDLILKCQNSTWQSVYDHIKQYIQINEPKIPYNVSKMLEELDQEIYGWGAVGGELTQHLKTKDDWITFTNLVNQASKNWKRKNPQVHESYFLAIESFCKKLDKIIAGY